MDRKDLKVQALLEKISNMTAQYENQIADLRVEVTIVSQERDEAQQKVRELENQNEVVPFQAVEPSDNSD